MKNQNNTNHKSFDSDDQKLAFFQMAEFLDDRDEHWSGRNGYLISEGMLHAVLFKIYSSCPSSGQAADLIQKIVFESMELNHEAGELK